MNFANILGIITTITELIVPGHPTCSVTGQVYNETELHISSGEISPRRPYDPIISANITERLYLEV